MILRVLLGLAMALGVAPFFAMASENEHLSELGDLRAVHAWARATTASDAFVFLELENTGDIQVSIDGGTTGVAAAVELVGFQLREGAMAYETISSVPINPGRILHLEPDALALRLVDLSQPLIEGEAFELSLRTSLGTVAVHVDIEAGDATKHSHAGHAH